MMCWCPAIRVYLNFNNLLFRWKIRLITSMWFMYSAFDVVWSQKDILVLRSMSYSRKLTLPGKSCYAPSNYRPSALRRNTLVTDPLSPHHNCHIDYNGHDIRLRCQSAMPGLHRSDSASTGSPVNRPMTTHIPTRLPGLETPTSKHSSADRRLRIEDKENTNANIVISVECEDGKYANNVLFIYKIPQKSKTIDRNACTLVPF